MVGERRVRIGLALVAAGLALAVAVAVAVVERVRRPDPARGLAHAVAVRASVSPQLALFADDVVARAVVLVDRRAVDPGSVALRTSFLPFRRVGPLVLRRQDAPRVTELRYEARLRCLTDACLPFGTRTVVRLPEARLSYRLRTAEGEATPVARAVEWPSLVVASRLSGRERPSRSPLVRLAWRADLASPPPVTYRVSPGLLAGASYGGALVLALLAGLLTWVALRRGSGVPLRPRRRGPQLPPLERALLHLESARAAGRPAEQRKALELLSGELGRAGERALSETARELAWSAAGPPEEATGRLSAGVRRAIETRRNGSRA